jgi:hypothetical protein
MEHFKGSEKRNHPRVNVNFVVSYRISKAPENYDLSQTKNVSQGGLMVTTNRKFDKDSFLAITIRFPFILQRIEVTGQVIESKEVVRNLIYETRVRFLDLDADFFKKLGEFIEKKLHHG